MGQVTSHISEFFGSSDKTNSGKGDSKLGNNVPHSRSAKKTDDKSNESSFFRFGILATPRNPLKRSRQISPIISIPQSILDIFSPAKKAKIEEEFLDFTFLDENETIEYYRKSKIMIILRGLPGSGKSTIAQRIQRKYLSSKICSADNFFMKNGEYVYERDLIKDAHSQCQENAIKAVQDQISVVIIDNTNLKRWEMKFYLDLAKTFNYIPVIVESKTSWRRNVSQLASKTVHDIDESIIEFKKNDFEDLLPMYYGWFLNEKDSFLFLDEGRTWIETVGQIPEFIKEFQLYSGFKSLEDLLKFYEPSERGNLHCTANYIGKNLSPENKKYIDKCESLVGKAYNIEVVGFVLTPRTFGARIKLSEEQLILWDKNDDEEVPQEFWDVPLEEESENNDAADWENPGSHLNVSNDSISLVKEKEAEEKDTSTSDKPNVSLNNSDTRNISEPEEHNLTNGVEDDDNTALNSGVGNTLAYLSKLNISPDRKSKENPKVSKENSLLEVNRLEKSWEVSSPKKRGRQINGVSPYKRSPRKQKSGTLIPENTLTIDEIVTRDTITLQAPSIPEEDKFVPTLGMGSRAHLTLGCGPDVKPVTTGLDLIFAIQKETISDNEDSDPSDKGELNGNSDENGTSGVFHENVVEGATIRSYGNGVWVIYLDESIKVKSVFSAVY